MVGVVVCASAPYTTLQRVAIGPFERFLQRAPALWTAGVQRAELHEDGTNRRKNQVHDLRGTFVTISLANGKTETWVADRTGHRSSAMVNRYRRQARSAKELGLGQLRPLDLVLPD